MKLSIAWPTRVCSCLSLCCRFPELFRGSDDRWRGAVPLFIILFYWSHDPCRFKQPAQPGDSLVTLPPEALLLIFSHLSNPASLCSLCGVCKLFNELAADNSLWMPLCNPSWVHPQRYFNFILRLNIYKITTNLAQVTSGHMQSGCKKQGRLSPRPTEGGRHIKESRRTTPENLSSCIWEWGLLAQLNPGRPALPTGSLRANSLIGITEDHLGRLKSSRRC